MYVLPILDYCSIFFGTMSSDDRQKLEKIQRRFTRGLCKHDDARDSYSIMYNRYGLKPLWQRRLQNGLTLTHNQNILSNNMLTNQNGSRPTRNNQHTIHNAKARTAQRSNFYTIRYAIIWNALPNDIRKSHSLAEFRRKTKQFFSNDMTHIFLNKIGHFANQFFDVQFGPKGI